MSDRRAVALLLLGPWFSPSFWDDVDYEVETAEVSDFGEFMLAGEIPVEPRPEFEADLRERMWSFVEARYHRVN